MAKDVVVVFAFSPPIKLPAGVPAPGVLRAALFPANSDTALQVQDVTDETKPVRFPAVPAGDYTLRAVRQDVTGAELGSPYITPFTLADDAPDQFFTSPNGAQITFETPAASA